MPPGIAERHAKRRRIIQTLVWFTLSLLISVNVPSIGYAVALIGGLAALFIFVVPGKRFDVYRYHSIVFILIL